MSTIQIPDHWTAEEALIVVNFLDDILTAIWDVHDQQMARILQRECEQPPEDLEDPDDPFPEIPF